LTVLEQIDVTDWRGPFSEAITSQAVGALEAGKVLFAPRLKFALSDAEMELLSPAAMQGESKNMSYRPGTEAVTGVRYKDAEREAVVEVFRRFHACAVALMKALCPAYGERLSLGFATFRPVEIATRSTSWRKDDTRLHVDAFPSRPVRGVRILRVFANVNSRAPRVWRVGEPFESVAKRFVPQVRRQMPGSSWLLHRLRITKSPRTEYDHLMLGIHDGMKADSEYQQRCPQSEVSLPSGSSWACFTDAVSHAAMSGQFAFEQTFYLPVDAMVNPAQSPLRILERLTGRALA
jgi:hypothetical protein